MVDGEVINRLIPAMVCLLLILTPKFAGWQTHHAASGLQEREDGFGWGEIPPVATEPADRRQQKRPDNVADFRPATDAQQPTSTQLWQSLETLLNEAEFQQIPIIAAQLAESLRAHPDASVYQNIGDLLMRPNLSLDIKAILIDLLSETATPDALSLLLELTQQNLESSEYILVLQAIARIGDNRWNGQFHEELSPILEAAWVNPTVTDPALLNAVGKALAVVGAPQGVDQLLLSVSGNSTTHATATNGTATNTVATNAPSQDTSRTKQEVAFKAVPQVRNPAAVEVLGATLNQEPLGTPAFEVSGNALAGISTPAATQKIVDWAQNAPAAGARNLGNWLSKVNNTSALAPVTLAQNTTVQSPEVKAVIDTVAATMTPNTALSLNGAMSKESVGNGASLSALSPLHK